MKAAVRVLQHGAIEPIAQGFFRDTLLNFSKFGLMHIRSITMAKLCPPNKFSLNQSFRNPFKIALDSCRRQGVHITNALMAEVN